jgi:hypothetical protein
MMPWDALATYVADVVPDGVNVYPTATASVVAPAVVIRPNDPWREPDRFCADKQHYVAIAVVRATTPSDGTEMVYRIHNSILATLPDGWGFESIGQLAIDESTGVALLASALRLSFQNGDLEEEEEE